MKHVFLVVLVGVSLSSWAAQRGARPVEVEIGNTGERVLYQESHALLIGVSDYTAGWPDLDSIPGELEQVEEALEAQGFHVVKHLNPDRDALEEAFKEFIDAYGYKQGNRLLFFFSGHGHTWKKPGRGYLVPTDAPRPQPDYPGAEFLRKALPMTQILAWTRQITAKHALFLFDSCFSGTVFKTKALPPEPPHITRATALPIRQFITAGDAGEEVPARSVFTPAFADALTYRWGDLNGDGYVTGMELGLYLQAKVPEHARQSPQFGKHPDYDLSRGDFVFRLAAAQPSEIAVAPSQVETTATRSIRRESATGSEFIFIPKGCFQMGQPESERIALVEELGESKYNQWYADESVHRVCVESFWLAKHEVTVDQFRRFVKATGYRTDAEQNAGGVQGCTIWDEGKWVWRASHSWSNPGFTQSEHHPVVCVSWNDANDYIEWLNRETGSRYRLPTEAEWEYAARAGTQTPRFWGSEGARACNYASVVDRSLTWTKVFPCHDGYEYTAPVGTFAPNPYTLHDILGNVWEWTCSAYTTKYSGSETRCTNSVSARRVFRGGSWDSSPRDVSSARRGDALPDYRVYNIGFRLAQDVAQ